MNRYEIALGKKPLPKKVPEPAIEPEKIYHLGIDIGFRRDPTAVAVCHLVKNAHGYSTEIDFLEESRSEDTHDIINWLRGLNCKYQIKGACVEQYYGIPVGTSGINFLTVPRITDTMENIYQSWVHGPEVPLRNFNISRHKEDALKLCLWSIHEALYSRPEIRGYNPRYYRAPEFNQDTSNRNYTVDMQRQLSDFRNYTMDMQRISELRSDSPYRGQI